VRLRALAPAKVNLCLFLGRIRGDGRHRLVTLFESVSLADEVELRTRVALGDEVVCPGVAGPNLVSRALEELRAAGWDAPAVRVSIHKRIPVAAGMGGGSADAAATLRIAERMGGISNAMIRVLAAELGADVPAQLDPGLALGTGAGGQITVPSWPLAPLAPHAILVLPSAQQLSTADVYAEADRMGLPRDDADLVRHHALLERVLSEGGTLPADLVVNDLEPAAISLCPSIGSALGAARGAGADHAMVCGSGPTVLGLYWGPDGPGRAAAAATELGGRFEGACVAHPVEPGFGFPLFA